REQPQKVKQEKFKPSPPQIPFHSVPLLQLLIPSPRPYRDLTTSIYLGLPTGRRAPRSAPSLRTPKPPVKGDNSGFPRMQCSDPIKIGLGGMCSQREAFRSLRPHPWGGGAEVSTQIHQTLE